MNQELIDYIKQVRAQGFTDNEIKKALIAAGWDENIVNRALSPAPPPSPQPVSSAKQTQNVSSYKKRSTVITVALVAFIGLFFASVVALTLYAKNKRPPITTLIEDGIKEILEAKSGNLLFEVDLYLAGKLSNLIDTSAILDTYNDNFLSTTSTTASLPNQNGSDAKYEVKIKTNVNHEFDAKDNGVLSQSKIDANIDFYLDQLPPELLLNSTSLQLPFQINIIKTPQDKVYVRFEKLPPVLSTFMSIAGINLDLLLDQWIEVSLKNGRQITLSLLPSLALNTKITPATILPEVTDNEIKEIENIITEAYEKYPFLIIEEKSEEDYTPEEKSANVIIGVFTFSYKNFLYFTEEIFTHPLFGKYLGDEKDQNIMAVKTAIENLETQPEDFISIAGEIALDNTNYSISYITIKAETIDDNQFPEEKIKVDVRLQVNSLNEPVVINVPTDAITSEELLEKIAPPDPYLFQEF